MNFTRIAVITALFACLCLPAAAQIIDPDVTGHSAPTGAPGTPGLIATMPPSMFLSAGGGYTDHAGMTASFGYPILGETTYSVTSADLAAKVDPISKRRVLFTTFRTGIQQVIGKVDLGSPGTLVLTISGAAGGASGADTVNLSLSTGGALIFAPRKLPHLAFYGSYRAIRDGTLSPTDAAVRSSVGLGVILKLSGK